MHYSSYMLYSFYHYCTDRQRMQLLIAPNTGYGGDGACSSMHYHHYGVFTPRDGWCALLRIPCISSTDPLDHCQILIPWIRAESPEEPLHPIRYGM